MLKQFSQIDTKDQSSIEYTLSQFTNPTFGSNFDSHTRGVLLFLLRCEHHAIGEKMMSYYCHLGSLYMLRLGF